MKITLVLITISASIPHLEFLMVYQSGIGRDEKLELLASSSNIKLFHLYTILISHKKLLRFVIGAPMVINKSVISGTLLG